MKITGIKYLKLEGTAELPRNPGNALTDLDVYPEFAAKTMSVAEKENGISPIKAIYIEIQTDEGLTGVHGALSYEQIYTIELIYRRLLVGRDPLPANLLWDLMYKSQRNGTTGLMMMAISALDNALWDLRGKYYGQPVFKLLGGPTRDRIQAYASSYPNLDFSKLPARVKALKEDGFKYQKWFFRYGPGSGRDGLKKNIEMARIIREAAGDDTDIMFDCRRGFDAVYAGQIIEGIAQFDPYWLEEPLTSMKLDGHRQLRKFSNMRIATGEHIFTRWHAKEYCDEHLADILQADPEWCGGITELAKIVNMAEPCDIKVVPHGHTIAPALNVVAAMSPTVCPLVEFLPYHQYAMQYFLKYPLYAENGYFKLPSLPGLGYEFDEGKILHSEELKISL